LLEIKRQFDPAASKHGPSESDIDEALTALKASVDFVLGRAIFHLIETTDWGGPTGHIITVHVFGLELERAAVEALRPIAVAPERKVEPKPERRPPGRPRGSVSEEMEKIFQHFDPIVARNGKFRNQNRAVEAAVSWADDEGLIIDRRTIERNISEHRLDWFEPAEPAKTGKNN